MEEIIAEAKLFFTENTTMVMVGIVIVFALVGFVLFRGSPGGLAGLTSSLSSMIGGNSKPQPTASSSSKSESMNNVCNMSSGMCESQGGAGGAGGAGGDNDDSNINHEHDVQMMMQQQQMMQSNGDST